MRKSLSACSFAGVQAPSSRVHSSGAQLRTLTPHAIGPSQSEQEFSANSSPEPVIREAVLETAGSNSRNHLVEAIRGELPRELPDVSRRTALVAVCGGAVLWWLNMFPTDSPDSRAIQRIATSVPYQDAYTTCAEAAAVTATLYSQMSSTMRMLNTGYLTDGDFQDVCRRRLQSPFVSESLLALETSLPVVGMELAYSHDLSGAGWLMAAVGHPHVDVAAKEKWEMVTLSALQRTRRVQRLCSAMDTHKYTAAGVTLMVQDLKQLVSALDDMLRSAPPAMPSD